MTQKDAYLEKLPDGFIRHNGGPCPIALDSFPEVMFRNGAIARGKPAYIWVGEEGEPDFWKHEGRTWSERLSGIVAYRPDPFASET